MSWVGAIPALQKQQEVSVMPGRDPHRRERPVDTWATTSGAPDASVGE